MRHKNVKETINYPVWIVSLEWRSRIIVKMPQNKTCVSVMGLVQFDHI